MSANCGNCRFGGGSENLVGATLPCRAKPPTASATPDSSGHQRVSTQWPMVTSADWCGEHQPEKPDAGAGLSLMAEAIAPFLAMANAVAQETSELVFPSDLTDDEGEPLNLSSADFLRLADAYARATGA